jgi:hypothetical protein
MPNGLNVSSYIFSFGFATSTQAFNAIEVFHGGGVTAQAFTAVGVYPAGTQLRSGYTVNPYDSYTTIDSSHRISNDGGSYLGGYMYVGFADDYPGGASGTCTSISVCDNPFIAGSALHPSLFSFHTGLGTFVGYDGTAWRSFALQEKTATFSGLTVTGGNAQIDSSGNVSAVGTYNANGVDGATVPSGFNVLYNRAYNSIQTPGGFLATGTSHSYSFTVGSVGVIDNNGWVVSGVDTARTNTDVIQAPNGGVTSKWLIAKDSVFWLGETAPAVSCDHTTCPPGQAKIYLDSTTHRLKVSEDGGAFVNLVGSGQWLNGSGGAIYYPGGNVGIGTASPQATLDVNSYDNSNRAFRVYNTQNNGGSSSASTAFIHSDQAAFSGNATGNWTGTVLRVSSYPNASSRNQGFVFQAGSSGGQEESWYPYLSVVASTGNVGIGTTTPGALLTIGSSGQATVDSSGNIYGLSLDVIGSAYNSLQAPNGGGKFGLGVTVGQALYPYGQTCSALNTPASGYGGIGYQGLGMYCYYTGSAWASFNPGSAALPAWFTLTDSGTVRNVQAAGAAGDTPIYTLLAANGTDYADWTYDGTNADFDTSTAGINLRPLASGSAVKVWSPSYNTKLRVGSANFSQSLDIYHDGSNAHMAPSTGYIALDGQVVSSGKVGIGTASPAQLLEVSSGSSSDALIRVGGTVGNMELGAGNGTYSYVNGRSWDLALQTSGTNRLYVKNSNGYVGIGNTSPGSLLTVGSSGAFTVDNSGNLVTSGYVDSSATSTNYTFKNDNGNFNVNGNGLVYSASVFNSGATSTALAFETNNGNFSVNGNGVIQTTGGVNATTLTNYDSIQTNGGFKAAGNSVSGYSFTVGSTAVIDNSGNFIGPSVNVSNTAYYSIQTTGGYKAGTTSNALTVGGTAAINNAGSFVGPYINVSGAATNTIQATSGGIAVGLGITTNQALYSYGTTCSSLNTPASGYGGFGYQSGSTYCYYNSGWHAVDLSSIGSSLWLSSGTTIYPNPSSPYTLVVGATGNTSGAKIEANGNITALGLFNSAATGSSIAFQTSNANFQVDGSGDISAAGQLHAQGHWMGYGGSAPSLTCVGSGCSATTCNSSSYVGTNTDIRGCVQMPSSCTGSCSLTVTFSSSYSSTPACVVTGFGALQGYPVTTDTSHIYSSAYMNMFAGSGFTWICVQ